MKCPNCAAANLVHDTRDLPYNYKGETSTLPQVTGDSCPACNGSLLAAAEVAHRPASQVVRELMREFVQRQSQAKEYDEFLRRKVEVARLSMGAGLGRSNDELEAEFAARRANAASQG